MLRQAAGRVCFGKLLKSFGWLWLQHSMFLTGALGGFGKLCESLDGFGRLWEALGVFGMIRKALGGFGSSGSFEALDALDALEGFGKL